MRAAFFVHCALGVMATMMPSVAFAQCALAGQADIDSVTPRGTTLAFGLSEQARVTLDGTRARVEGLRPIAFEGLAASRDVRVFASEDRSVLGVVSIAAGTPLHVNRVRGGQAASFVEAGAVRVAISVPCSALALAPRPATGPASPDDEDLGRALLVRGRRLEVFTGPTSARALVLALRPGSSVSDWPLLTARGASGSRVHVRAMLAPGVTLDGWVDRDEVDRPGVLTACGCDAGTTEVCDHMFASETYRGPARIAAGAELRDAEGHVWGHVVDDSAANVVVTSVVVTSVVVSTVPVTTRTGDDAASTTTRTDTVWVEGLAGLVPERCRPLGVQVDPAAVLRPSPAVTRTR